jgi:hydroxymethylpyrimidine/phosphomethylpyrimidine kinase
MRYFGKALTIAGSDSGGGAGIQADLKTFQAFNVYGASVITAITAQNTYEIKTIHEIPSEIVGFQIDAVMEDIGADAVKTGMLFSQDIIEKVSEKIIFYNFKNLVVDPVMISKAKIRLLSSYAEESFIKHIIPLSLILTPNIYEAEVLSGISINDLLDVEKSAKLIYELGPKYVLIKGGHLEGNYSTDILYDGKEFHSFKTERVITDNTHGLGCTLSSAITANLASGKELIDAINISRKYIFTALKEASQKIGKGKGPLYHNINILNKED